MVLMCGRPVWSDRMQDTVGFEDSERLGKCHTDVSRHHLPVCRIQ